MDPTITNSAHDLAIQVIKHIVSDNSTVPSVDVGPQGDILIKDSDHTVDFYILASTIIEKRIRELGELKFCVVIIPISVTNQICKKSPNFSNIVLDKSYVTTVYASNERIYLKEPREECVNDIEIDGICKSYFRSWRPEEEYDCIEFYNDLILELASQCSSEIIAPVS